MDNQNENKDDFYYGKDDDNTNNVVPDENVVDETSAQTETRSDEEVQKEAADVPKQQPYDAQPNNARPYNAQPYNAQPYNAYGMPDEMPKKSNTCGIISLILGILSTVLACCCYTISIPLGIAAVILAIVSMRKKETTKGFAIAGIILGSLGFIFAVVDAVTMIYLRQSGMYDEIMKQYMDMFGVDSY